MERMLKYAAVFGLVALSSFAAADSTADFLSGTGYKAFLAYGVVHAFGSEHDEGVRSLDTLLCSGLAAEGLKRLTRVERPDHTDHESFPSGHATAAFAIATFEADHHRSEAPLWYLGAGLIAQSRVDLHRHHETDVLAGAALGFLMARAEERSKDGFLIRPTPTGAVALGISLKF